MDRFKSVKRTAIDGVTWWVVWDNSHKAYSTWTCFGRYCRKKDCDHAIRYYSAHPFWGKGLA